MDDFAEACLYLLEHYDEGETINVGMGLDLSIRELAELIAEIVGYKGEIVQDLSKPDGTPQKLLDVSRINNLGWRAKTNLREGLESTYEWFLRHEGSLRSSRR